ncbi:MAG TPA: hypothetical protein VGF32_06730, partial [Streptosporangiaceae bacterium]
MVTSVIPEIGSLSFRRIVDVRFETFAATLDAWLSSGQGGEVRFGRTQLLGPVEHERELGTRRIQVRLARGPVYPMLRMRLEIDR